MAGGPSGGAFAFSTQNWDRPAGEIGALMSLLRVYARKEKRSLVSQGVEVRILGDLERLDAETRMAVDDIARGTEGGRALRLNLMISYSGREELLRAVRLLAAMPIKTKMSPT